LLEIHDYHRINSTLPVVSTTALESELALALSSVVELPALTMLLELPGAALELLGVALELLGAALELLGVALELLDVALELLGAMLELGVGVLIVEELVPGHGAHSTGKSFHGVTPSPILIVLFVSS
jgi:hypothetical protein